MTTVEAAVYPGTTIPVYDRRLDVICVHCPHSIGAHDRKTADGLMVARCRLCGAECVRREMGD